MVLFLRMIFSSQVLKKALLVAGLILCGTCGLGWANGTEAGLAAACKENVIYFQKIIADSNDYLVEFKRGECEDSIDKLSFYSLRAGKKVLLREDDETDYFISATILGDNAECIYVTLMNGTGHYAVDVYFIEGNKVEKTLSVGSDFPPNFLMLKNGNQSLLIDRNVRYEERIPDTYDVYEIAGKKVIHHKDVKFSFPKNFKK